MPGQRRRGRPPHADVLTPAEWRVLHALQHGLSSRQIAVRDDISRDGVKYHVANAMAKLGITGRKGLRTFFREPRHSVLARKEKPMSSEVKLGAIAQISRTVRDIKESEDWYGKTLGLTHLYTFGGLAFFDCGGTRLYLHAQEQPAAESILYLRVEDIRAAYDQLQARGVAFISAPHIIHRHGDGTEEWLAVFNDPEGRPLAIMAQVRP